MPTIITIYAPDETAATIVRMVAKQLDLQPSPIYAETIWSFEISDDSENTQIKPETSAALNYIAAQQNCTIKTSTGAPGHLQTDQHQ